MADRIDSSQTASELLRSESVSLACMSPSFSLHLIFDLSQANLFKYLDEFVTFSEIIGSLILRDYSVPKESFKFHYLGDHQYLQNVLLSWNTAELVLSLSISFEPVWLS